MMTRIINNRMCVAPVVSMLMSRDVAHYLPLLFFLSLPAAALASATLDSSSLIWLSSSLTVASP